MKEDDGKEDEDEDEDKEGEGEGDEEEDDEGDDEEYEEEGKDLFSTTTRSHEIFELSCFFLLTSPVRKN